MFRDRIVEQRPEQRGAFRVGHAPANDPATEDVEDHIEIEVVPLCWPHQFGDVPGPDFIGAFRQKFRLLIIRMAQLPAPFADLAVLVEDPVNGADRPMIDAFIEESGVDFRRCLIGETWRVQQIQHRLPLQDGQGPGRPRPRPDDRWRCAQPGTPSLHRGARNPERRTDRGSHAAGRNEGRDRFSQGSPPFDASGMPSNAATFFGCR